MMGTEENAAARFSQARPITEAEQEALNRRTMAEVVAARSYDPFAFGPVHRDLRSPAKQEARRRAEARERPDLSPGRSNLDRALWDEWGPQRKREGRSSAVEAMATPLEFGRGA
jgi:hypothetical protein